MKTIAYTELNCISNYSFLRGASHPEELVKTAATLGYQGLAITDECSLAGAVKAHITAKKLNFPLIIGSEFFLNENIHLIVLVKDQTSYTQVCRLITQARRQATKGSYSINLKSFNEQIKNALVILCPNAESPILDYYLQQLNQYQHNRIWLGLNLTYKNRDQEQFAYLNRLKTKWKLPWVALGMVQMHQSERFSLFTTLNAIRTNTQVEELRYQIPQNSEHYLRSLENIETIYPRDAIEQTAIIHKQCQFSLSDIHYQYPKELVPENTTASEHLKSLVNRGSKIRWPDGASQSVKQKIEYELKIIQELSYEYYFLTVYHIVQFARNQGILCQGRGSAANSVVCFCLGITEVDPHKVPILFERFISKERDEPPDIDVDFEHQRREEVIQYIYQTYGRHKAALTAALSTYRRKSAIRDVGKALGFSQDIISQASKSLAWWDEINAFQTALEQLHLSPTAPKVKHWFQLVKSIIGFPRHLTQHVGGFIISNQPLNELIPIENAAMPNRTLVQWDKDDIEALGFLKVDVLALGMLSAIKGCFELIADYRKVTWTMANIPQEDPQVYEMLSKGDSIGVFQVESRAQMAMLPRLAPKTYYDLVIEVAIVRPGPIQGKMVHPYLKRRQGLEPLSYPSKALEKVLKRTLGVPIFQEQVIQIAMVAAGFSAGEADQLRRAMASWRKKGELVKHQEKLRHGLKQTGYSDEFAEQIIEQINGFGEYGFPESHAASFALLVYVSAWLKYHEPSAFYCALLNAQPMGFYSVSQLIQDAQRHQVTILPIDIFHSSWSHQLAYQEQQHQVMHPANRPPIRLGLSLIKGLQKKTADKIEQLRSTTHLSQLDSIQAFADLAQLSQQELRLLANANALKSLTGHRHQAHWQVQGVRPFTPLINHHNSQTYSLKLDKPSAAAELIEDHQHTGLCIDQHVMQLLRNHVVLQKCKKHSDLIHIHHKGFVRIAGIVTNRQRPGTAKGTLFLTLEDETGSTNIIIWKNTLMRYRTELLTGQLLLIKGTLERADNPKQKRTVTHIIAGHIEDNTHLLASLDPSQRSDNAKTKLSIESRDFH